MVDYYSNEELLIGIETIVEQINNDNWKPDVVVGLIRDGVIPAVYLSYHLKDCSFIALDWSNSRYNTHSISEDLDGYLFSDSRILFVDAICDTENVFSEIYTSLGKIYFNTKLSNLSFHNIRSAVLHCNMTQKTPLPKYYHKIINHNIKGTKVIYPWQI